MSSLAKKLCGLKNPVTPTVFEALFDSIVEQQISLNVAHVLERRVVKVGATFCSSTVNGIRYLRHRNNSVSHRLTACGVAA
jgi:3-methyladenine DNA glycosylase/8-oxoguanine DNA glycosylase